MASGPGGHGQQEPIGENAWINGTDRGDFWAHGSQLSANHNSHRGQQ